MISLDDDELDQVMRAAAPLPPKARGEFLQAVAAELEAQPQRGPGVVYRACRDLQRQVFRSVEFGRQQVRVMVAPSGSLRRANGTARRCAVATAMDMIAARACRADHNQSNG